MTQEQSLDGLPTGKRATVSALVAISVLEAASLAVLLINLATGNNHQVAQAVGPVHGTFYLAGIALTFAATRITRARLLSVIPVIGSLLAILVLRSAQRVSLN